jgi:diaminopimelate decarboxylase
MTEPSPPREAAPVALKHAPHGFAVQGTELLVGGLPISQLAQRVGQTPFYAYDREQLNARVAALRQSLPAGLHLHYAIKANPLPAVVQHMAGLVDGLDVASAGELRVALNAGARPDTISFAGPAKRDPELHQAVAAGVLVNVESARELPVLAQAGQALGLPVRIALRLNPDFELKGSGMRMGGGPKPFGVDVEQVPQLVAQARALGLAFEGFHLYAGSQSLRADAILQAQTQSYELALRLAQAHGLQLRSLNLGGGFGVPYFPGEQPLDMAPVAAHLHALVARAATELPGTQLVLELGRYLVAEAGVYVCRVVDKKVSRGHTFLVCDGGLHHHLAASGNFGQVVRKNYPVTIGNRQGTAPERVSVVGPLCTPLDVLADRMELPQAEIGDLVVVMQSGAYGASASPQGFLGHPPVVEVLV